MRRFLIVCTFFILIVGQAESLRSQTTGFTYQGSLNVGGTPANGNYDFHFALYDAPTGGSQLGATAITSNVPVVNGVFTVHIGFGNQFTGASRYLEIRVRPSGQPEITTLTPRQLFESAPYSIKSLNAGNAELLGGVVAGQYVLTTDPRMNDPRPPIAGSPSYIQNGTAQQPANFSITGSGTADFFNSVLGYSQGGSRILASTGTRNLFAGTSSGLVNTGTDNSFVGYLAGLRNTSGAGNAFFGSGSGVNNINGSDNSFFGRDAGAASTSSLDNSFFGSGAGKNSTGSFNSFFGLNAGMNTSSIWNSFFGVSAGLANVDGSRNSFFGFIAGRDNTSGTGNSFVGVQAGVLNTTGSSNTFIGQFAGGSSPGTGNTTGDNNTLIGASANVNSPDLSFTTAIGSGSVASISNSIFLGRNGGQDTVRIPGPLTLSTLGAGATNLCLGLFGIVGTCSSSARYKSNIRAYSSGLDLLRKLRPVSFTWKDGGMRDLGLVAEEVSEIEPLLTTTNAKGEVEGVKYDRLGVVLINVVREQQTHIDALDQLVKVQAGRIDKQQIQIEALQRLVCKYDSTAEICQPRIPQE